MKDVKYRGGAMRRYQPVAQHEDSTRHIDAGLRDDLQVALLRREFFVVYQPIVDVASNIVLQREALVRWQHPVKGLVMPDEFIETAECTGLVVEITDAVLAQVCCMLKVESASSLPVPVSINLSAVCLAAGGVPDSIRSALERFDVPPDRLIVEITETAMLEQSDRVMSQLEALRAMNVRIVMDDFGIGYSSLANLWRYPISGLKVDRLFAVHIPYDERMCSIVASMIELARKLGLSVVVEGVENEQQANWIRQFPDVLGQGYLFGKPQAIEQCGSG